MQKTYEESSMKSTAKQTNECCKSGEDAPRLNRFVSTFADALTSQQDKNWTRRGIKECKDECDLYGTERCPNFEEFGLEVGAVRCDRKGFLIPDEQDKQKRREVLPVNPKTKEKDRLPELVYSKQDAPKGTLPCSFWIALSATGNLLVDTKPNKRGDKEWLVDMCQCIDFLSYLVDKARLSAKTAPHTLQISSTDFLDFVGEPYTKKAGETYTRRMLTGLVCLSCLCVRIGNWYAWGGVIDVLHNSKTNLFYVTFKSSFFSLIRTAPEALRCPALDGLRMSDTALFILGNEILKRSSSFLDRKRGTAEALKVSTLLDYVSSFISNRYSQKEKRRGWLEEKLESLKAMGVFSEWYYTRAGQKTALTLDEVKKMNLTEWKACLVRWKLDKEATRLLEERSAGLEEKRILKLEQKETKKSDTSRKNT